MRRLSQIERFLEQPSGWWLVLCGLCILLLLPLAWTGFPPILDYPNHLARLFILAEAGRDPVLARMWQPHWAIIPDLGIDLVIPPLIRIIGPFAAGKLMLAGALLAPLFGALLFSRAAFKTRLYWPMTAGLMAYNIVFVLGFINYLLSVGAALAAAGCWLRLREQELFVRVIAGAASACALFFVHLFGVAFFGLLVCAAELGDLLARHRRAQLTPCRVAAAGALISLSFAGPLVLFLLGPRSPHAVAYDWSLAAKLFYFSSPFLAYRPLPGLLAALAFIGATVLLIGRGKASLAPGIRGTALTLLLAYACLPFALAGGTFVDTRIPLLLALSLSAGVRPPAGRSWPCRTVAAALVLAFAVSWSSVARVWAAPNAEAAELRTSIAPVPAGNRVLVAMPRVDRSNPYWRHASPHVLALGILRIDYQLPALLAIDRRAFWPFLFSDPSQHPIRVRAPYDALAVAQGAPPDLPSLLAERSLDPHWPAPFLKNWPATYDYLLVIDAAAVRGLAHFLPQQLELVNCSRFAALFRVRRPAQAAPPSAHHPVSCPRDR